jgi:hypothetical protein
MDMQHKQAAWKSNRDMHTPYSRSLLFPLSSGLGLWNPVSNVVRQREEKERIRAFSLRSALLLFFAFVFLRAFVLFFLRARGSESANKARAPASVYEESDLYDDDMK